MLSVSRIVQSIFLIAVCLLTAQVQAAEAIGRVLMAAGEVTATAGSGENRSLKRRAAVFEGDTIRTGDNAQVQMRFKDGSILSLRANSAFLLETYNYHGEKHSDNRVLMRLLEGGFRTITGVIGHDDPKAYRVETPVATIGIRGTNYEAVQESSNALVTAVWQGGIRVSNKEGSLDLGMGADYNFARIIVGETPKGLLEAPAILQTPLAQPKENAATGENKTRAGEGPSEPEESEDKLTESKPEEESGSIEERTAEGSQQEQLPDEGGVAAGDEDSALGDDGNQSPAEVREHDAVANESEYQDAVASSQTGSVDTDTRFTQSEINTEQESLTALDGEALSDGIAAESNSVESVESTQNTLALASESETEANVATEVDNYSLNTEAGVAPSNDGAGDLRETTSTPWQPTGTNPSNTITDARLTDAELESLDRLGMLIGCRPSAANCTHRMQGGKASDGANGDPIITSNTDGPGEAKFMKIPSQEVYRRDSASVTHLKTINRYSTPISWGIWNGSQSTPIIVQKDADDPTAKDLVTEAMIFATAVPTTPEKLVGTHSYHNVVDQLVLEAGTTVVSSAFSVDFSTGVVSNGKLNLHVANGTLLPTTFNGNIIRLDGKGGFIDARFNSINGLPPLTNSNNSLGGVFTGANGEAAVMGFSFVDPANAAGQSYNGVYILGR